MSKEMNCQSCMKGVSDPCNRFYTNNLSDCFGCDLQSDYKAIYNELDRKAKQTCAFCGKPAVKTIRQKVSNDLSLCETCLRAYEKGKERKA